MIHIDIETRSNVNLLTHGVYNYATDLSTELLCLCWAVDDGTIHRWHPGLAAFPAELAVRIENGEALWAHNAQFERLLFQYVICNDHDCPVPQLEQWYCTATLARAHALPGSLEMCARALGLKHQKDKRGMELIRAMSIPPFEHTPELLDEMMNYCAQDVRVEREIHHTLPELPAGIWAGYWASERINDRGIVVDTAIANAAIPLAESEQANITEELLAITDGEITKPRSTKLTRWVYNRLGDLQQAIMHDTTKAAGISLDNSRVQELLEASDAIPDDIYRAIELKALASKSSVAKYQTLLNLADPDDHRVRGAFIYLGAAQTGRFSSRGLQLHNLPRASVKGDQAEQLREQLLQGKLTDGILAGLSKLIRPSLMAGEGNVLVACDWSAIEARILPWASADRDADTVLDVFRNGGDIYVSTAAKMGSQYDRQIGKVASLSLGYAGGVGAFQAMARGYHVAISDAVAQRIVQDWRRANGWAPRFWRALETAVADAISRPHIECPAGRVSYRFDGQHLFCTLPSGRYLMYPFTERKVKETPRGPVMEYSCIKSSLVPAEGRPWPRMTLWGGLLAENLVQAIAADLLVNLLLQLNDAPVTMHVHDEVVLEVPAFEGQTALKELTTLMTTPPWWAGELPLAAEGWVGKRFRK